MEKVLNDEETIKEKNRYLRPLYADLKLMIRKVSMTDEALLLGEFNVAACKVLASRADDVLKNPAIEDLKQLFAAGIHKLHTKTPTEHLKHIHTQIT